MQTQQLKVELLNRMNSKTNDYQFVGDPDKTIRKSDGKFSYSNWESAVALVQDLVENGVPLETATETISTRYVEDAPKVFNLFKL